MRIKAFIKTLFLLILAFLTLCPGLEASEVAAYTPVFKPYIEKGGLRIAIRQFERKGKTGFLTVDPFTFETHLTETITEEEAKKEVVDAAPSTTLDTKGLNVVDAVPSRVVLGAPFVKALYRYTSGPVRLQNHGIRRAEKNSGGVFLTADLCPSKRPFEKEMFIATTAMPRGNRPVPIALAISGRWIKAHMEELDWILREIKGGRLQVTWINHSYTHPFAANRPLKDDFLLTEGVDFEREVLDNERLMLSSGITPSPFFRFPGLIADKKVMEKLRALSLIPVGADAWLAKGEGPSDGSIILVHGNGNEPKGVEKLLRLYGEKKDEFRNGAMKLLPLPLAFSGAE
ncbi:MAG: polysaccharide deacetylase [Deltaproteobacteria bacterium]|nr:polysaccharide deacetylase [Deltaproteobacteria bacterium]